MRQRLQYFSSSSSSWFRFRIDCRSCGSESSACCHVLHCSPSFRCRFFPFASCFLTLDSPATKSLSNLSISSCPEEVRVLDARKYSFVSHNTGASFSWKDRAPCSLSSTTPFCHFTMALQPHGALHILSSVYMFFMSRQYSLANNYTRSWNGRHTRTPVGRTLEVQNSNDDHH